jgi:predicted permease
MTDALIQIMALLALGVVWSYVKPAGLEIVAVRNALTNSVYFVFLPALVLRVLWHAQLDINSVKISISAIIAILSCLLLAIAICRYCQSNRPVAGAMILAAAFPNATYLGLPLLENTFGSWARSIAIQFDMFASLPLVLTVGIIVAGRYGNQPAKTHPIFSLYKVVPLWAAGLAVYLNLAEIKAPVWLDGLLMMMAQAVIPLMLFAAGLALSRGLNEWRRLPTVIPVALIQLFVMPFIVWQVAKLTGMSGDMLRALVIEGALPSMALGVVLCDRFGLNTGIYAAALALTTLMSFFTLPLWYHWV